MLQIGNRASRLVCYLDATQFARDRKVGRPRSPISQGVMTVWRVSGWPGALCLLDSRQESAYRRGDTCSTCSRQSRQAKQVGHIELRARHHWLCRCRRALLYAVGKHNNTIDASLTSRWIMDARRGDLSRPSLPGDGTRIPAGLPLLARQAHSARRKRRRSET